MLELRPDLAKVEAMTKIFNVFLVKNMYVNKFSLILESMDNSGNFKVPTL